LVPAGGLGPRYASEDDLLAESGYDAQTGQLTNHAMTIDRRENGGLVPPPPSDYPNEYESYDDIKTQQVDGATGLFINKLYLLLEFNF